MVLSTCVLGSFSGFGEGLGLIGYQAEKAEAVQKISFSLVIRSFRLKPYFYSIFLGFAWFLLVFAIHFLYVFSVVTLTPPSMLSLSLIHI